MVQPARLDPPLTNFAAGEASPDLSLRSELQWWSSSARRIQNMVVSKRGPAIGRGGTRFVAEIGDSTALAELLNFTFAEAQAYALEAGAGTLRFYRNKARLEVDDTDAVISNGTFVSGITGWTQLAGSIAHDATNQRLSLTNAAAVAQQSVATTATGVVHVLRFEVIGVAGDKINLRVGTSSGGSEVLADFECATGHHAIEFTPGASPFYVQFRNIAAKTVQIDNVSLLDDAAFEIGTPYAAGDVMALRSTQSYDTLYVVHSSHAPRVLKRSGDRTWQLEVYDFVDGPYLPENVDQAKTLQPSATSGLGITITASGHAPFKATDVGRLVRIAYSGNWGYAIITGYTSTTVVTADVRVAFGATTAAYTWRLGLYSATTGYPGAVRFIEERLVFADNVEVTGRFDGSKSQDFDNFTPGTEAGDPLAAQIASNQVNRIRWIADDRRMLVGTSFAEIKVGPDEATGPLTPTSVRPAAETKHGSAAIDAVRTPWSTVFVQRHGRKIYELRFSFGSDIETARELSVRATHLFRNGGGITKLVYQQEPESVIWAVRADGMLVGVTYQPDDPIVAGHRHWIADGLGLVETATVVNGADGADELWLVVRYTIGGQTKRYVEVLEDALGDEDPIEAAFCVDSGLSLDNTIAATLTPSAVSGAAVTLTAGSSVFVAGDVGRQIRYRYQPDPVLAPETYATALAEITGYTSGTVVTAEVADDAPFPSLDPVASGAWRMTVDAVSGLDHLEGQTVVMWGDGGPLEPAQVVSGGGISLPSPAATVHVGRRYVPVLIPQAVAPGTAEGVSHGTRQKLRQARIKFQRTAEGVTSGPTAAKQYPVAFRQVVDMMDFPVPLFSGFERVQIDAVTDPEAPFMIRQPVPGPITVVGLVESVLVQE